MLKRLLSGDKRPPCSHTFRFVLRDVIIECVTSGATFKKECKWIQTAPWSRMAPAIDAAMRRAPHPSAPRTVPERNS
jgi:hypothetical protein